MNELPTGEVARLSKASVRTWHQLRRHWPGEADRAECSERLVFVHGEQGDPDPPFTFVVTFEEMAGKTVLSMRLVFENPEARDQVVDKYHAVEGGNQTLARLAALVEESS